VIDAKMPTSLISKRQVPINFYGVVQVMEANAGIAKTTT
jgi:hypothetical protein